MAQGAEVAVAGIQEAGEAMKILVACEFSGIAEAMADQWGGYIEARAAA